MLAVASACRTPAADVPSSSAADASWTMVHVERAQRALRAYGLALRPRTTSIAVHETTASFVAATGQEQAALRAWTTWGTVHLLHPRLWGDDGDAVRTQRLTHELCHAALLHSFADEPTAIAARVPRFFTEGACSVVAGQARVSPVEVIARAAGALPLTVDWFARDPDAAYGAAHALATLLERDYGPRAFATVMEAAARDGRAGCVERALLALTGAPSVPALWQRVVDSTVDRPVDTATPAP